MHGLELFGAEVSPALLVVCGELHGGEMGI